MICFFSNFIKVAEETRTTTVTDFYLEVDFVVKDQTTADAYTAAQEKRLVKPGPVAF